MQIIVDNNGDRKIYRIDYEDTILDVLRFLSIDLSTVSIFLDDIEVQQNDLKKTFGSLGKTEKAELKIRSILSSSIQDNPYPSHFTIIYDAEKQSRQERSDWNRNVYAESFDAGMYKEPYSRNAQASEKPLKKDGCKNSIAEILHVIGYCIIIIGVVASIIWGIFTGEFVIAFWCCVGSIISGISYLAFREIIELLTAINNQLSHIDKDK